MQLRELMAAVSRECAKKNVDWEGEAVVYFQGHFYPIARATSKLKDNVLLLEINHDEYTESSPLL